MRKSTAWFSLLSISTAAALLFSLPAHSAKAETSSKAVSRTFSFTYEVHVPATKDLQGHMLLWLPLPQQDAYQQIEDLRIESSVAHTAGHDPDMATLMPSCNPVPTSSPPGLMVRSLL